MLQATTWSIRTASSRLSIHRKGAGAKPLFDAHPHRAPNPHAHMSGLKTAAELCGEWERKISLGTPDQKLSQCVGRLALVEGNRLVSGEETLDLRDSEAMTCALGYPRTPRSPLRRDVVLVGRDDRFRAQVTSWSVRAPPSLARTCVMPLPLSPDAGNVEVIACPDGDDAVRELRVEWDTLTSAITGFVGRCHAPSLSADWQNLRLCVEDGEGERECAFASLCAPDSRDVAETCLVIRPHEPLREGHVYRLQLNRPPPLAEERARRARASLREALPHHCRFAAEIVAAYASPLPFSPWMWTWVAELNAVELTLYTALGQGLDLRFRVTRSRCTRLALRPRMWLRSKRLQVRAVSQVVTAALRAFGVEPPAQLFLDLCVGGVGAAALSVLVASGLLLYGCGKAAANAFW